MPGWRGWLRKAGLLSDERAKRIEAIQKRDEISFGEALLKERILDRNGYLKILVTESPYPLATPGMLNSVPPGITNILSSDLAQRFKCFPLWVVGRRLQVAFLDPTDLIAINEVCQFSGMEIEPFCCHPDDLFAAIEATYEPAATKEAEPSEPQKVIHISKPPAKGAQEASAKKKGNIFEKLNPFKKEKTSAKAKQVPEAQKTAATPPPSLKDVSASTEATSTWGKPAEIKEDVTKVEKREKEKEKEEVTKKIEKRISLVSPFRAEDEKKGQEREKVAKVSKVASASAATSAAAVKKEEAVDVSLSPFFPPKIEKCVKIAAVPPPEPETIFTPEATTDTFDALKKKMELVKSKDEVAEEILGWLKRQKVTRGAILIIQKNLITGWRGFGYNLEGPTVARIKLPLDEPSIFKTVADTKEFFHGPLPKNEVEENFVTFLQNRPGEIFLVPTIINDHVFGFIYAEPKPDETINPQKKIIPLAKALSDGFTTLIKGKRSS